LSGQGEKPTEQGPLTSWRRPRERLVRTQKETDRVRPTYILETAEGGTCQDTEINRPSKAHLHPEDGRGRDLSGHERSQESEAHLHPGDNRGRDLSGPDTKTDRARPTHSLEMAEGGTCQDTERNRLGKAHSLPGHGRGKDRSGHRKKKADQAMGMGTHILENAGGRSSQ
jgi:hypothetical protein